MENKNKMQFDKKQYGKIINEYLGLSEEYLEHIDISKLKKDIETIIDKYINDKRDLDYILKQDIMYANSNIKTIETINGITIYENLI